ncbi:MAG: type III-B CRISPR module RAMP protein Cmr6 [Arcobacteraceae bacterium]
MPFYYLNKINTSFTKAELEKSLKTFGRLKFLGNFKEDNRNQGFHSSIADFSSLEKEEAFIEFCKSKKIFAIKRKEEKPQEVQETKHAKPFAKTFANPSFHFYKDKAYGKGIENFTFTNNFQSLFAIPNAQTFTLTTLYPGLLVGSGYNHPKLKESDEDFQLGFFFDHTTGLPIISGSSIKGLLRSVCEKKEFMQDIYGTTVDVNIFEDQKTIFYDAFIVATNNKDKKIFGTDYITSHFSNEKDGMFKDPNPVKFLKILPEVTFKFQFSTSNENLELFKKIILDFGLGAKTNVGYGKFTE